MKKSIAFGIVGIFALLGGFWYFNQDRVKAVFGSDAHLYPGFASQEEMPSNPYTSADLTAKPVLGKMPPTVRFSGRIEVLENYSGAAIIFFGDGTSDVMTRRSPTVFEETWEHTYNKVGEYDATLVVSDESNVDADVQVSKDSAYYKNRIVQSVHASVWDVNPTNSSGE